MRIYRHVSKKKYLHGKRVYEYQKFYVPVPKRFEQIMKSFASQDINIRVEPEAEGFMMRIQVRRRHKQPQDLHRTWPKGL